jgi:hypothetical protein
MTMMMMMMMLVVAFQLMEAKAVALIK